LFSWYRIIFYCEIHFLLSLCDITGSCPDGHVLFSGHRDRNFRSEPLLHLAKFSSPHLLFMVFFAQLQSVRLAHSKTSQFILFVNAIFSPRIASLENLTSWPHFDSTIRKLAEMPWPSKPSTSQYYCRGGQSLSQ
jgi:hypothetical protein